MWRRDWCADRLKPHSPVVGRVFMSTMPTPISCFRSAAGIGLGRCLPVALRRSDMPTANGIRCSIVLPLNGGIVFDVGAQLGYTTGWFAQRAAQVYCFEPSPENQDYIADVLRVRRFTNVELVRSAVGERSGIAALHVKRFPGHHSLADIGASPSVDRIEVPLISLDEFSAQRSVPTFPEDRR